VATLAGRQGLAQEHDFGNDCFPRRTRIRERNLPYVNSFAVSRSVGWPPQNILDLSLRVSEDTQAPNILQVYWSIPPRRDPSKERGDPHPGDILLSVIHEPTQFSSVLASWLERQESWHDARVRFFNSFAEQRQYDIDRLIGSANMFDILPSSAIPTDVSLTDDFKEAIDSSRKSFKALPVSPERD